MGILNQARGPRPTAQGSGSGEEGTGVSGAWPEAPSVGLARAPSFLPHPFPALLLAPFFARPLTLVPRSLFLHHTETLATQTIYLLSFPRFWTLSVSNGFDFCFDLF